MHEFRHVDFTAQSVYLRPTRDTRFDLMADQILIDRLCILFVVRDGMGPGPDQLHVAQQYVYQLWQFIQA